MLTVDQEVHTAAALKEDSKRLMGPLVSLQRPGIRVFTGRMMAMMILMISAQATIPVSDTPSRTRQLRENGMSRNVGRCGK